MVNNRYAESITAEELNKFELSWFKGEIVLVEDMKTFNKVFPRLLNSEILGFDTEPDLHSERDVKTRFH